MQLPVMRLHRPRKSAYILLFNRRHYLGPWASKEADDAYRKVVRKLLNIDWAGPIEARLPRRSDFEVTTAGDLFVAFESWAKGYYLKRGAPTTTVACITRVKALLEDTALGDRPLYGPPSLRANSEWLVEVRTAIVRKHSYLTRGTLNTYVGYIVRCFAFGKEHGLCDGAIHADLASVAPVRKRRPPAPGLPPLREGKTVHPVPRAWIRRVRPHLSRTLRVMIDVQLLTGMRPEELCAIRPMDIFTTKNARVAIYRVSADWDKTEHEEGSVPRQVWLGPRAMKLLNLIRPADRAAYFFNPTRAMEEHHAERSKGRRIVNYASHALDVRRSRRRAAGIVPNQTGEKYITASYCRALVRGCARAIKAYEREAANGVGGTGEDQLHAERPMGRFTPHRLRHNCATEIANREHLKVAQAMLGHKSIQTTAGYVKAWDRHAAAAALRYG